MTSLSAIPEESVGCFRRVRRTASPSIPDLGAVLTRSRKPDLPSVRTERAAIAKRDWIEGEFNRVALFLVPFSIGCKAPLTSERFFHDFSMV